MAPLSMSTLGGMKAAWRFGAAAVAAAALFSACSGGGDDGGATSPAPSSVPQSAHLVAGPEEIGAPDGPPGNGADHLFFSTSCEDDVLAVVTDQEVVYAELPCDRAVPQEVAERFLGLPVRVRVVPSNPAKLYVESDVAGSLEFTVGRVWIVTLD